MIHRFVRRTLFAALSLTGIRCSFELRSVTFAALASSFTRLRYRRTRCLGLPKFHFAELGVALLPSIGTRRGRPRGKSTTCETAGSSTLSLARTYFCRLFLRLLSSFPVFLSILPFLFLFWFIRFFSHVRIEVVLIHLRKFVPRHR